MIALLRRKLGGGVYMANTYSIGIESGKMVKNLAAENKIKMQSSEFH
jgi:hypothetical protein